MNRLRRTLKLLEGEREPEYPVTSNPNEAKDFLKNDIEFRFRVPEWRDPDIGLHFFDEEDFVLPVWFGNISDNLTELVIEGCKLNTLPLSLQKMTTMEELQLSNNSFYMIPDVVFKLSMLEGLNFENNLLLNVPNDITRLRNLDYLNVAGNFLTELPSLESMPNLKILVAISNQIEDFPSLPLCIEQVELGKNKISTLPEDINKYQNLQILGLEYNRIIILPLTFSQLPLESLDLKQNYITDQTSKDVLTRLGAARGLQVTLGKQKQFIYPNTPVVKKQYKSAMTDKEKASKRDSFR